MSIAEQNSCQLFDLIDYKMLNVTCFEALLSLGLNKQHIGAERGTWRKSEILIMMTQLYAAI